MRELTTRRRRVSVPECVEELTPVQYEYFIFLSMSLSSGVIGSDYFRVRWLSYLMGMGRADYTILMAEHIAEIERQGDVLSGFFITDPSTGKVSVALTTPVNLLPEYKGYRGPGDWLRGVPFGVFVECLTVLESLNGESAEAVTAGYEHIARKLYHIPEGDTVPELLTFHAPTLLLTVWTEIQSGPIDINGQKIDFRIIFKSAGGSRRADDKTGWAGITFEVAKEGLFGNVKEVEATDMWDVLLYLYKCKFEYINELNNQKR